MVALLPSPELQFCDGNGIPYAAGTLQTYVPGTTTPKQTWNENTGTVLNTNPIVLDSAGRCIVYGDGLYRLMLQDALGNTIFDQNSSTLVSAAMAPVVIAPTIAAAQALLGIVDNSVVLATLTSGAAAEIVARAAETTRALAAEASLASSIGNTYAAGLAEVTRAKAAEAALAGSTFKSGASAGTDTLGHVRVTFPTPFTTVCGAFVASFHGLGLFAGSVTVNPDVNGADVWLAVPSGAPVAGIQVYWIATGT